MNPESSRSWVVFRMQWAFVLWLATSPCAWAADWLPSFQPFLTKYCLECHDKASAKGELVLEGYSPDLSSREGMRTWTAVHDRILRGEMPPKKAAQPTPAERGEGVSLLAGALHDADVSQRRPVLRRLNRVEYENAVSDLFEVEVFVKELLPQDASAYGFDNIGSALSVSTEQMQAYLEAADVVLDAALGPPSAPRQVATTLNLRDTISESGADQIVRKTPEGVVLFNSGYNPSVLRSLDVPGAGLYRVRIQAAAVQSDKPVTMLVYGGVWGLRDKHVAGFFDVPPGAVTTIQFTNRLWERGDTFEIYPVDTVHRQNDPQTYAGPGLFVGDIRVEGPLEAWPPPSRQRLLGKVNPGSGTLKDAEGILAALLPRAFRRPVTPEDLTPFVELVRGAMAQGRPFERALRAGLKGVLCSPEFLFLDGQDTRMSGAQLLASRLSFFLWSSIPDAELMALTEKDRIRDPAVLRQQVERMLRDPKARRFTENFTGQWLKLRDIDFTLPDERLYPDYDELLKRSMLEESHRFFQEVLDQDLSLTNFIDSDFVFVNERLARHYGIEGITGQALRRVPLPPGSVRGGVLTQAAVLKVTANGTATSPVMRGVWLLDNILGRPTPPPPRGVPAIEPDIRGATTARGQLEKHRSAESCARCHREIDPPGFALESFDVIGGWRTYYRILGKGGWIDRDPRYPHRHLAYRKGPVVDPRSETAEGRAFQDIREYKRMLLEKRLEVARCLTGKLMTYALGRGLGFSDRGAIEAIVAGLPKDQLGFRTLIHDIVRSESFQTP